MNLHKEGYAILLVSLVGFTVLNYLAYTYLPYIAFLLLLVGSIVLYGLFVQFFRNPSRPIANPDNQLIYAPADGEVVVVEEAEESEYFEDKRLQISIFMSPLNVHVNRNPIGGIVKYIQYHPGKYLVAWHPKSSTDNERMTTVIDNGKSQVLVRQIAGAVARRIRNYLQTGQSIEQGSDMGFIKFGSRVDLFLPLDTDIQVQIGDKVKGNSTIVGKLKE